MQADQLTEKDGLGRGKIRDGERGGKFARFTVCGSCNKTV